MKNYFVRRVVCAAIKADNGDVLIGIRHYSSDMHEQINKRSDGSEFHHRQGINQGFVDQHGIFMTREEAYLVAFSAGQIIRPAACIEGFNGPKLYSEGLY